mgnify:CR=1 FL=1
MPVSINTNLKPIIFIHTQKTAGHSIRVALESVGYKWGTRLNKHDAPRDIHFLDQFISFAFVDNYLILKKVEYFSFAFVRNPFDACVSRFFYHHRKDKKNPQDLLFQRFPKNKDGFSSWIKSLKTDDCWTDDKYNWKDTFKTQKKFLSDDSNTKILVDFVGKYEQLNVDFQKICNIIECDNNLKDIHINASKRKSNYREYYDDDTIEIIESMYKEDLEYFNYEF